VLARVDFAKLGISVDNLRLVTEQGEASVIGQASLGGDAPGISLALSLSEMPSEVAQALWPSFVARKSRQWIETNVKSAVIGPATLQVALPPEAIGRRGQGRVLPDYAMIGSVPFRDAEFLALTTFPPITNASGDISFANATATVHAASGIISVPGAGILDAGGTTFAIPELGRSEPHGELHLELSGPVAALATLSDTAPLSVASERGIDPAALSGNAELSLRGRHPPDIPAGGFGLHQYAADRRTHDQRR
jgi:hypothetical protein